MTQSVTDLLDDLDDVAASTDEVSVGQVMDRIGQRGTGAVLLIPALLGISPLGMIPGVPTLFGIFILIAAVQIVAGRRTFWMPQAIRDRAVRDDRLKKAVSVARGPARWLDRWTGSRLQVLENAVTRRLAALVCILLAICLPPLELVPGAALIPLAGIFLFGLAMTLGDGVVMLIAFLAAGASFWGVWTFMPFI